MSAFSVVVTLFFLVFQIAVPRLASGKVLVTYPVIEEPEHREFYADILHGIGQRLERFGVEAIPIDERTQPDIVLEIARRMKAEGMVLLGAKGLHVALTLEGTSEIPLVVGSANVSPDTTPGISGVSIFTRLEPLLDFTRRLLPKHRTLLYVEARDESWYIKTVQKKAGEFSFTLELHPVSSPPEALRTYNTLFPAPRKVPRSASGQGLGKDISQKVFLLPMSLEALHPYFFEEDLSWRLLHHHVPVITNVFRYAWGGVLVGAYPDPIPYGRQIADLLLARIEAKKSWKPKVELARDVKIAYNARYGRWIGIELPSSLRHEVSRLLD